jgi:alkylhydroperoxidase/carboxymuconolactone decarboxylase family protein YurZ
MEMLFLPHLREATLKALDGVAEGAALAPLPRALIQLGLAASVTSLERGALSAAVSTAYDRGATPAQVQEVIALVSGLGVHSLMISAVVVLEQAQQRGLVPTGDDLDDERQSLWDARVGDDPFWSDFEREMPGFLKAMLVLSPDIFAGFFDYCAIPWKSGTVPARVKELIAMASDATPAHRFGPGFRVHMGNAIKLGCGRTEILEALSLAAAAPPHRGTP